MPKSSTLTKFGCPSRLRISTFSGFRSRWMTLTSWAACNARQICVPMMQRPPDVEPLLAVDELAELEPLEVLHDEEERTVGRGPRVGDVDDVGVADLRGRARLAPKPLDEIGRLAVGRVQDLQRHALADVDVLGLVDAPHATLAAQLANVVAAADDRAEHGRRRCRPGSRSAQAPARGPPCSVRGSRGSARARSACGRGPGRCPTNRRAGRLLDAPVRGRRCACRRLLRRQRRRHGRRPRQRRGFATAGGFAPAGGIAPAGLTSGLGVVIGAAAASPSTTRAS